MEALSRQIAVKFKCLNAVLEKTAAAAGAPRPAWSADGPAEPAEPDEPGAQDDPGSAQGPKKKKSAAATAGTIHAAVSALELRWALAAAPALIAAARGNDPAVARTEFMRAVVVQDVLGELGRLWAETLSLLTELGVLDGPSSKLPMRGAKAAASRRRAVALGGVSGRAADELRLLVTGWPREGGGELPMPVPPVVPFQDCPECAAAMAVDSAASALRCECGVICELPGTVFEESQLYSQEGQKAKSGSFSPNRHYRLWIQCILAREPLEVIGDPNDPGNYCGERVVLELRAGIRRRNIVLRCANVENIREILLELSSSDSFRQGGGRLPKTLYKHAPLLLKQVTGIGPPALDEGLLARAENIFSRALESLDRMPKSRRIATPGAAEPVYRRYYPYYIYKIFDAIIPKNDTESRRVLFYIYMQDPDTVAKRDADWLWICEDLADPDLVYEPTILSDAKKYAPI